MAPSASDAAAGRRPSDDCEASRRVAALCASTEMRNHYSQTAEHYCTLAEVEELGTLKRFPVIWKHSLHAGNSSRIPEH